MWNIYCFHSIALLIKHDIVGRLMNSRLFDTWNYTRRFLTARYYDKMIIMTHLIHVVMDSVIKFSEHHANSWVQHQFKDNVFY